MEMAIEQRLERSQLREEIAFRSIPCEGLAEPLVAVERTPRIVVRPIWTVDGDIEGRLYADYIATHPEYRTVYVRRGLLSRLHGAAALLPPGRRLVVHAGHRPLQVQREVLSGFAAKYRASHPGCTDEHALEHARTFVSDPAVRRPPHCCGAAVDVEIFDADEARYLDFGGPVNADNDISFLHSDVVTAEQRRNRLDLLQAMLAAGFASNHAEWWHYSFGDEVWAWFYGKDASLYDLVEPNRGSEP